MKSALFNTTESYPHVGNAGLFEKLIKGFYMDHTKGILSL